MTTFITLFKAVVAITLISGGAALAENKPPVVTPTTPVTSTSNAQSDALAQALSAAFAGAVSGSSSNATQQQAQQQGQSQSSRNDNQNQSSANATGGDASASTGNQSVYVDNSNRQRMAANTAATVIPGGYGPANCFGDTNPSGSFGASVQVFGFGATANSQKASNVCAVAALAGPAAALGYLQRMDPNMPRRIETVVPTGRLICPAHAPTYVEGKGCK